jgi:hypothetical protein
MLPTSSTITSLQVNQFDESEFNALDRRSNWQQQQRSRQRSFKQSLSAVCKSILNLLK